MSSNQTIADAELTAEIKEYNYNVGMKQALDRLEANPDFQKVIIEGYFNKKAVDGVSLLATDYVRAHGLRPAIMESLVAISQLKDYFLTLQKLGVDTDGEYDDEEDDIELSEV